jgi:hypothetical protein
VVSTFSPANKNRSSPYLVLSSLSGVVNILRQRCICETGFQQLKVVQSRVEGGERGQTTIDLPIDALAITIVGSKYLFPRNT